MNVLILGAGDEAFNTNDGAYPLCLTEIEGKTVIERVVDNCKKFNHNRIIFALRQDDIKNHNLDCVVKLVTDNPVLISLPKSTKGAACSALHAMEWIDNGEELLITSLNEFINVDYAETIKFHKSYESDCGVISFESIHPRYSFVHLDHEKKVIEAAEKKAISKNAITGSFWFKEGKMFVEGCKNSIRKGSSVNDRYYISPVLNELILEQKKITCFNISSSQYYPLKSERHLNQLQYKSIKQEDYESL